MGSLNPPPQLSLDFKPTFIPKTITQFLGQVSRIGSPSDKILKVDDFVSRLETEMRKIDAFKRELPLCMLLINDAIIVLKEESMVLKKSSNAEPVLEEFIPLKKTCDEDEQLEMNGKEKGAGDKRNWLSSTQLWNTNDNTPNTNQTQNWKPNSIQQITKKRPLEEDDPYEPCRNPGRAFIPFKGCCAITMVGTPREEDREELQVSGLSLITPGSKNPVRGNVLLSKSSADSRLVPCSAPNSQSNLRIDGPQVQPPHQQTSRKQRRCWSTELHRRFVNALQQLGGSQAATPKQIRELMQVDGLTNDEVKSHLQKYRLHTRRLPSSNTSSANQSGVVLGGGLWMGGQDQYVESSKHGNISQSGSPDGPLLISTIGGTSTTGDNSMDDGEDEKSENYCWKGHLHTDDV
ncbi:transcription factor HHO6-like isoform X1 [Cynara cardunculus var. scolymus]|uniref:Homeodomain-like protein n=1 Tax=Cynara cardunculus var. scolymus TaxID=59895 RepID=A0A118JUZ1_CYNCS|nr:transcription factor HHO6-like isoform X1 [Cynara cardunculus var. scolymus]KVH93262.1 Homeodomain-like protein [Cynara cardunculus var. scolymus]